MSTTQPDLTARLPFFVYGTLRVNQPNWAWAFQGLTTSAVTATLSGATMHDGPGFPFVTLTPSPDTVQGDVFTVSDTDYTDVAASLDHLEGFTPGSVDNLYERVAVTVTTADNTRVLAWTYVVATDLLAQVTTAPRVPQGDWVTYNDARPRTPRPLTYRPAVTA